MIGQHLHDFDSALCDYLTGNVVQHMDSERFTLGLRERLTSAPLLAYLQAQGSDDVHAEEVRLLLADQEMYRLELVAEDHDLDRAWKPSEPLHRRHVETLQEVRANLSRQAAEDWSDACGQFARRLEDEQTRLSDGIGVVRDWVGQLRTLLRVMGAVELLPAPEGMSPTPTCPKPNQTPCPPASSPRGQADLEGDGLRAMLAETQALQREMRDLLVSQKTLKDFYSTAEVATLLGKAEFTVREWCRHGRVRARKQGSGRGKHQAWVIAHEELQRLQREGLLPAVRPG